MLQLERQVSSFPSKLIAVTSSSSTVDHAVRVSFLVPMLMGPPFRKERKPEVGLPLCTRAVEVASGSWSSCGDSVDTVSRFIRRCPSAIVSVWTLSLRLVSALDSGNDGPAALDGDAPRMQDDMPVIPDVVDPVITVVDEDSSAPSDDVSSSRRFSAFSCNPSWICAAGSIADIAGTTQVEPAVDSTLGGDPPSSCDASSGVSLL